MDRFGAMTAFCKVVELGSFAAAAKRLDVSTSAISRLIAQLEAQLEARLLNRTTRRISLTEDGRAYYERCLQLLADLEEAEELVGHTGSALRGTLRLTAPISFGPTYLAPAIADFLRTHPQVRFAVSLSDRQLDLIEEGLDMAIRVGELGSQNLVARPIGQARLMVCAAPAYLAARGTPKHPSELTGHDCLTYAYASESHVWRFVDAEQKPFSIRVGGAVHANNGVLLRELAAAGMGLTMAPDFILQAGINDGRLVEVLQDFPPPPLTIYAAYPSRRHLSAKVRGFASFLQMWLAQRCPSGAAKPSRANRKAR